VRLGSRRGGKPAWMVNEYKALWNCLFFWDLIDSRLVYTSNNWGPKKESSSLDHGAHQCQTLLLPRNHLWAALSLPDIHGFDPWLPIFFKHSSIFCSYSHLKAAVLCRFWPLSPVLQSVPLHLPLNLLRNLVFWLLPFSTCQLFSGILSFPYLSCSIPS
jgi:hypothetical protein